MAVFEKILVAIDISDEADFVVDKAKKLAQKFSSEIILVHVVEPIIVESGYDLVAPVIYPDIENNMVDRSQTFLKELVKKHELNVTNYFTPIGSVKAEIHKAAIDNNVNIIVLGTHGRHGVALLLGSTANSILHGAPCDVFCVKIQTQSNT